jgi:hypothetical protein
MLLHALDQYRQQRLQPLAANEISRLPQQHQRLAHLPSAVLAAQRSA